MSTKLICFDFDNTLVNGHFHNVMQKSFGDQNESILNQGKNRGVIIKKDNNFHHGGQLIEKNLSHNQAFNRKIDELLTDSNTGLKHGTEMLKCMREALQNGHKVAITSYTLFPEVVEPTLRAIGLTEDEIKQIVVVGGFPKGGAKSASYGKEEHINAARAHYQEEYGIDIDPSDVILVDDDKNNVNVARSSGHQAVEVPKEVNPDLAKNNYFNSINDIIAGKNLLAETENLQQNNHHIVQQPYGMQQPQGQFGIRQAQAQYGIQQPQYGIQQPQYGMQQPQYGIRHVQGQYGIQQPQAQYGMQQPQYGMQQPQYGMQQPQYGMQQPQYGMQQPQYGIRHVQGQYGIQQPQAQYGMQHVQAQYGIRHVQEQYGIRHVQGQYAMQQPQGQNQSNRINEDDLKTLSELTRQKFGSNGPQWSVNNGNAILGPLLGSPQMVAQSLGPIMTQLEGRLLSHPTEINTFFLQCDNNSHLKKIINEYKEVKGEISKAQNIDEVMNVLERNKEKLISFSTNNFNVDDYLSKQLNAIINTRKLENLGDYIVSNNYGLSEKVTQLISQEQKDIAKAVADSKNINELIEVIKKYGTQEYGRKHGSVLRSADGSQSVDGNQQINIIYALLQKEEPYNPHFSSNGRITRNYGLNEKAMALIQQEKEFKIQSNITKTEPNFKQEMTPSTKIFSIRDNPQFMHQSQPPQRVNANKHPPKINNNATGPTTINLTDKENKIKTTLDKLQQNYASIRGGNGGLFNSLRSLMKSKDGPIGSVAIQRNKQMEALARMLHEQTPGNSNDDAYKYLCYQAIKEEIKSDNNKLKSALEILCDKEMNNLKNNAPNKDSFQQYVSNQQNKDYVRTIKGSVETKSSHSIENDTNKHSTHRKPT